MSVFVCLAALPWAGRALAAEPEPFHEGLCPKWGPKGGFGYVNYTGEWVIPPTFRAANASPFSSGIAEVRNTRPGGGPGIVSQRSFINYKGELVDDALAQRIMAGLQKVEKDGKWGFADPRTGKLVIDAKYDEVCDFSEGLALVRVEGASPPYRWIDYAGREAIVLPALQRAESFHDGLALVKIEVVNDGSGSNPLANKCGFIDRRGTFAIEPKFDSVAEFSEGRARVQNDGKWGFIDYAGKIVIPVEFEAAQDFSEGVAAVKVGGQVNAWCFVDFSGKVAIPAKYLTVIRSFSHGMAYVDDGSIRGFIDHAGNMVIEAQIQVLGG